MFGDKEVKTALLDSHSTTRCRTHLLLDSILHTE